MMRPSKGLPFSCAAPIDRNGILADSVGEAQRTDRYVLIPDGLILAFAHDPLAVDVYTAIARLTMAAKDAVPLAARDLAAWMGSDRAADRAAIMRRIVKLEEHGWLMITRTRASKHYLLPTWGRDRAGIVRPWRLDESDNGRPAHVRGRRVPLGLLDTYVGRLDPKPGQGHALISRYFTRPLLDLTDIGVYEIGLRAEVAPTPRLRHLGLYGVAGVTVPADEQSLMELAAAGQLSTLVGDVIVAVCLSIQGQSRLGIASIIADSSQVELPEYQCGSLRGSDAKSAGRSHDGGRALMSLAQEDAQNGSGDPAASLIAWDVGKDRERINHDSSHDSPPTDPACDALLASMGVCERRKLGAVPYTLIACWQNALTHPGMEAQFASPIGFAVAQMQGDAAALPVILTRDDRNCGGRAALLEIQKQIAALHLPLQFAPIRLAVATADAPARGMTLADFAPTSDIAQEYRRTAEPILHFLEATQ